MGRRGGSLHSVQKGTRIYKRFAKEGGKKGKKGIQREEVSSLKRKK